MGIVSSDYLDFQIYCFIKETKEEVNKNGTQICSVPFLLFHEGN